MGMSRCYSLMKCLLILFNIIFLVVGAAACGASGWALWDGRAGETAAGRAALCAVCAWGCALCVAALAALAGAVRHSASLLALAFALLALTAVAEGGAAWWGAAHVPQLRRMLADRLHSSVTREYGSSATTTQLLDSIQRGLECCGAESTRDWQNSAWGSTQLTEDDLSDEAPAAAARQTLDLSVSAPNKHYWVPASCCATYDETECQLARRIPAASGSAPGLHTAPCSPLVIASLENSVRVPLPTEAILLFRLSDATPSIRASDASGEGA
ncbi:tetraspanin family domain-containing protein [Phthorimaea operculella]|nr:tetraspanin family domain-containing protein [Phthorimaea operculella]